MTIEPAQEADLPAILKIQKQAFLNEAQIYRSCRIGPLQETPEDIRAEFGRKLFLKAVENGRVTGSVRGCQKNGVCEIEKLSVEPESQNLGIGKALMHAIEERFKEVSRYALVTGLRSEKNLSFYRKLGYELVRTEQAESEGGFAYFEKVRSQAEGTVLSSQETT